MLWLRRWWNALRPGRLDRDIDRELAVAGLAALIPATRAALTEPVKALRQE